MVTLFIMIKRWLFSSFKCNWCNNFFLFILYFWLVGPCYGWNAIGHRLIVHIAYDHLTIQAKHTINHLNHAMDVVYKPVSFVNAATWLDEIRGQDISWFTGYHYENSYFSADHTPVPTHDSHHALWAIEQAIKQLESCHTNDFEKGLALRILIHIIADIHQPLHTANRVSQTHPKGDSGGNLFELGDNPIASNLHAYWDKGAGLLIAKSGQQDKKLNQLRVYFNSLVRCDAKHINDLPKDWVDESYQIARHIAYQLQEGITPSPDYQLIAQHITEERIAQAGCRLANMLNSIMIC